MGHFDDFDLDIIQVDSTAENETKGVTSGFWCSYIVRARRNRPLRVQ